MFIPFMTVDRRQNPDRTLVRGTRISSYRKLQCYKCYKCVKQLIVRVGCGKGQRMVACHSFILWFVQLHITLKAHTLYTRTRTNIVSRKIRKGWDQYRDDLWMGGKWTGSSPGYLGELRPDRTGILDRRLRGLGLYEFIDLISEKFEEIVKLVFSVCYSK